MEDGYAAYERGDIDTAVAIWRELAEQGNATAQLNLGQLYRLGKGVEQNDIEAVKWYIRAAQNGSEIAAVTLVQMEQEGRASKADVAAAFPESNGTLEDSLAAMTDDVPSQTPAAIAAPAPAPAAQSQPAAAASTSTTIRTAQATTPIAPAEPAKPAEAAKPVATTPSKPPATPAAAPTATRQPAPFPRARYVVQLLSSANRKALENYAAQNLQNTGQPQHIVLTVRGGKTEYLLLMGPYPSQSAANAALAAMPAKVQQGMPWAGGQPWVRNTDSVLRIWQDQ